MKRVTIELNAVQTRLVDELLAQGLYGRSTEEAILRMLDRGLQRLVASAVLDGRRV